MFTLSTCIIYVIPTYFFVYVKCWVQMGIEDVDLRSFFVLHGLYILSKTQKMISFFRLKASILLCYLVESPHFTHCTMHVALWIRFLRTSRSRNGHKCPRRGCPYVDMMSVSRMSLPKTWCPDRICEYHHIWSIGIDRFYSLYLSEQCVPQSYKGKRHTVGTSQEMNSSHSLVSEVVLTLPAVCAYSQKY